MHTPNHLAAFLLVALLGVGSAAPVAADEVEFLFSTPEIRPATTFELRFAQPVIESGQIGRPADPAPAVFDPEIPGDWVWMSSRSAVFSPSAPLKLATEYRLRPNDDWKGRADFPKTDWGFRTPAFGVTAVSPQPSPDSEAMRDGSIQALFNAAVAPEAFQEKARYRSNTGNVIAAAVRAATSDDYFPTYSAPGNTTLTWYEQFYAARGEQINELGLNRLVFSPQQPLGVNQSWTLEVPAGIPSASDALQLETPWSLPLGKVTDLEVKSITAEHPLGIGPRVVVQLTRSLPYNLPPDALKEFVKVEPEVADLRVEPDYSSITIRGDFVSDEAYTITIAPGLPSSESDLALSSEVTREVTIPALGPRLMLPTLAQPQLASGNRQLEIRAVNVGPVTVEAKLLKAAEIPKALTLYQDAMSRRDWGSPDEVPVPWEEIPGESESEKLDLSAAKNVIHTTPISLDRWLGDGKPGALFLQATSDDSDPRVGAQTLLMLTDLGLVWKIGATDVVVYAHSLSTGAPKGEVELQFLDQAYQVLETVRTDPDGFARLSHHPDAVWLVGQSGQDANALRLGGATVLPRTDFDVPYSWSVGEGPPQTLLLFTDRGLYLPGDEVHLRGMVRVWEEGRLTRPAGEKVSVRINDARGRLLQEETLEVDATGSFELVVETPMAPTGNYTVDARLESDRFSGSAFSSFLVEEYEPAAFTLSVTSGAPAVAGEALPVAVASRYQTGEPVEGGRVSWNAKLSATSPYFEALSAFRFGISPYLVREYLEQTPADATLTGSGTLDEAGQMAFEVAAMPAEGLPYAARINVDVIESGGQTLSEELNVELAAADFYFGRPEGLEPLKVGESVRFPVIAATRDGEPIDAARNAVLTLYRIEHQTIREQQTGGAWRYRSQTEVKKVSEQEIETVPLRRKDGFVEMDAAAAAQAPELAFPEQGQYLAVIEGEDDQGRKTIAGEMIDVFGEQFTTWHQKDPNVIELVPDQPEYEPGETARVFVKSAIEGHALVTVERDTVLDSFTVPLAGASPAVEIPLSAAESPNAFVSVTVIRGSDDSPHTVRMPEYRAGYCQLVVGNPEARLQAVVEPAAEEYEPGDEVEVTVRVRDASGKPLPGANVTLYAVDEAVLALTGYRLPDPLDTFFEKRPLAVQTGLSLRILKDENVDSRVFANKGFVIGGKGLEMGLLPPRSEFPPLAYWNTGLTTGADGSVSATFEAPDTLTRYRVMAVIQEGNDRFGQAAGEFRVRKPLMLKPSWPRLTRVGDVIDARVLMQNGSSLDGNVQLGLLTEGPARPLQEAATIDTRLPAGKSKAISLPVEITGVGEILWSWSAELDADGKPVASDAVENRTQSRRVTPLRREIDNPRIGTDAAYPLQAMDPQLLESDEVAVEVTVSKSRLIEIREAVESLLEYPYGCLEQTTSSLLPWYTMNEFRKVFPEIEGTSDETESTIVAGLERIFRFQRMDGGLAYWPGGGDSSLWPTAYATIALAEGVDAGYLAADDDRLGRVREFLSQSLRETGEARLTQDELAARVLSTYALARLGAPEPAYHEKLYEQRGDMGAETRLFLALSIAAAGGPPEQIVQLQSEARAWDAQTWFGSEDRLQALQLLTDLQRGASPEELDAAFERLLQLRRNGEWLNTQANAWAMLASVAYDRQLQRGEETARAKLTIDGKAETVEVTSGKPTVRRTFAGSKLDPKSLEITAADGSRLFTEVRLEAYVPPSEDRLDQHGLSVVRTYQKVLPGGKMVPAEELKVGDKVLVTLRVSASEPGTYVALSDPLPALFEAINPNFATQQTDRVGSNWSVFNSHRELRSDQALFFADRMPAGTHTVQYLARVRQSGSATAPPSRVELMYDPFVYGLGRLENVRASFE